MFERRVSTADVRAVLDHGDVSAEYPDDQPYPSRLMLGLVEDRPVHVVAADTPDSGQTVIITVYEPDPSIWDDDFRRRRRR